MGGKEGGRGLLNAMLTPHPTTFTVGATIQKAVFHS